MTVQLDLFDATGPASSVRWDDPGDDAPYDELVRLHYPGHSYILYDMRIGTTWLRVIIGSEKGLRVYGYADSWPERTEFDPVVMELAACWDFDLDTTPAEVARAIIGGAVPLWTSHGCRAQSPKE